MPVQSKELQETFGDFSDLFGEAAKRNVTIHESAVPALSGAVAYSAIASRRSGPLVLDPKYVVGTWRDVLNQKEGEVIMEEDIWKWIRKWFPDPVQGELVRADIQDWVNRLGTRRELL